MPNNKTFCIAPWVQTVMRSNGKLNPCCQIISDQHNIKNMDLLTYYSSKKLVELRNNMITGIVSDECASCYHSEEQYGTSMRTELNLDYKFIDSKYYEKTLNYFGYDKLIAPIRLELHIGNICNLKCLTCNPADSSAFLTENAILKISNHDQRNYTNYDEYLTIIVDHIKSNRVDLLDLRGGESMLEPKIQLLLLNLAPDIAKKIKLRIQTNGTVFSDTWSLILNKFRSVEIMLSIDAFGSDNEYIRFPSKWSQIIDTCKQLTHIHNIDNLFVNITVSNLNLPVLPKLLDWLLKNEISCKFSPLTDPAYYNLLNLPNQLLTEYVHNLRPYQTKFKFAHMNQQLDGIIAQIDLHLTTDTLNKHTWLEFCNMISIRDKHRNNSIFDVIPQLREYWNA